MNAKDCENIGLILAASHATEYVREEFFKLDPRIREEHFAFAHGEAQQEAIEDRMTEILCDKFGKNYGILKACDKEEYRKAREQAAREVYNEDDYE
ncbi:MAG: hypothetical protein WC055_00935 [Melioribacteraceae bacterium]